MRRWPAVTWLVFAACGGAGAGASPPPPPADCSAPTADGGFAPAAARSFPGGDPGWIGGASDFPVAYEPQMHITLAPRVAPGSDAAAPDSFYTYGDNRSDDLFLFIERRVAGLEPRGAYCARFCVELAADVIGHHLYGKAGAASFEPAAVVADMDGPYLVMNVDKGNQTVTGPGALPLGRLREWTDETPGYVVRTLCTAGAMGVRADPDGAIWIFAGAESGFEVAAYAYWLRVDLELVAAAE